MYRVRFRIATIPYTGINFSLAKHSIVWKHYNSSNNLGINVILSVSYLQHLLLCNYEEISNVPPKQRQHLRLMPAAPQNKQHIRCLTLLT